MTIIFINIKVLSFLFMCIPFLKCSQAGVEWAEVVNTPGANVSQRKTEAYFSKGSLVSNRGRSDRSLSVHNSIYSCFRTELSTLTAFYSSSLLMLPGNCGVHIESIVHGYTKSKEI